ncbi:hypothetical protein MUB24_04335 [Lederbergia sp. NSJ-179]|uniref:hypothetical protein n=1 Tax=Lederbergia sp. NSJ-179 TaxID=2931402 RepID=UPI001FD3B732|nr:hypothetical protein [Lederbergia sp. NSJ-179]MCJ7840150.1 hypothetical protein [Lederbergia sp. NSJ-179]
MIKKSVVQKAFTKIIEERVFQVAWKKAKEDPEYDSAVLKRKEISAQLSEALTTDTQRELLDELEMAWDFAEGLMAEYAYQQGLADSQMIHKELSKFGISVTKESVEQ